MSSWNWRASRRPVEELAETEPRVRIAKRLEPCTCGCRGSDPWHRRDYDRTVRGIVREEGTAASCYASSRNPYPYDARGVARFPFGEREVVRVVHPDGYVLGWAIADEGSLRTTPAKPVEEPEEAPATATRPGPVETLCARVDRARDSFWGAHERLLAEERGLSYDSEVDRYLHERAEAWEAYRAASAALREALGTTPEAPGRTEDGEARYPDTADGARAYLREEMGGLLEVDDCPARPDPWVRGVWELYPRHDGRLIQAVVYLAGYDTPWGEPRQHNDVETEDF